MMRRLMTSMAWLAPLSLSAAVSAAGPAAGYSADPLRKLTGYSAEDVANQYGEQIWDGKVDLAEGANNAMVTTAIPVTDVLKGLTPGAYVVTAKVDDSKQDYWQDLATQWFIVTDLGISTVSGDDGALLRKLLRNLLGVVISTLHGVNAEVAHLTR